MYETLTNIADWFQENWLALLGALAWFPAICPYFKKPIIKGRIVSFTTCKQGSYTNKDKQYNGILYIMKLSLISTNKNFNLKEIEIDVQYPSGTTKGFVYYSENNHLSGEINGNLRIPTNQYLPFNILINKDQPTLGYLCFITEKEFEEFENINITFRGLNGEKSQLKIKSKDIKPELCYFESELLEHII